MMKVKQPKLGITKGVTERFMHNILGFLEPQPNEPIGTLHCFKCRDIINQTKEHLCKKR